MKKILMKVMAGIVCGLLVSVVSFYVLLFLAKTFLSIYSSIAITAFLGTFVLLGIEYVGDTLIVVKKVRMFYCMCFIFYFAGVTVLTYLVLHGMDQIALFLYYIPIGLLIFGLRVFLYMLVCIRRPK